MYKKSHESIKEQHNILNASAKSNSDRIAIKHVKELLKEDPHTIHVDGIRAKETPTILGEKI
jgi:hypothetical protein